MPSRKPLPPVPGIRLPQDIADLVAADGQPRQAVADDGSVHMLFLDGTKVRSCLLADWPAEQARLAAAETERQIALATRQRILTLAQSAAGVRADDLLAGQVKALLILLLHKEGALDKDGKIRPLGDWVR